MEADEAICGICLDLLIKPVVTPCGHRFCLHCFESALLISGKTCPFCRRWISNFSRQKRGQLVHAALWRRIQTAFPQKCRRRLTELEGGGDGSAAAQAASEADSNGSGEEEEEELSASLTRSRAPLASQGELFNEYQQMIAQAKSEVDSQRRQEEEASQRLVEEILAQEEMELERKQIEALMRIQDEEAASEALIQQLLKETAPAPAPAPAPALNASPTPPQPSQASPTILGKRAATPPLSRVKRSASGGESAPSTHVLAASSPTASAGGKRSPGVQLTIDVFWPTSGTSQPKHMHAVSPSPSLSSSPSLPLSRGSSDASGSPRATGAAPAESVAHQPFKTASSLTVSPASSPRQHSAHPAEDKLELVYRDSAFEDGLQTSTDTTQTWDSDLSDMDAETKTLIAELEREESRRRDRLRRQEEADREFASLYAGCDEL